MQFEEGTYTGRQAGTAYPVFWVWRPAGQTTEYWVLYKPGQSGGFHPPGADYPKVEWTLTFQQGGGYGSGCGFLSWVATQEGHSESELEVHEHTVATLNCAS